MLVVPASLSLPAPGGVYYPPALLVTIPTDAACAVAMLLLALTLVPRPSRIRDTPWRTRLAAANLVAAVWASLLIVAIIAVFYNFISNAEYQSGGFSGDRHTALDVAEGAANVLAEVIIALVVALAAARLTVVLVQAIRLLRTDGASGERAT